MEKIWGLFFCFSVGHTFQKLLEEKKSVKELCKWILDVANSKLRSDNGNESENFILVSERFLASWNTVMDRVFDIQSSVNPQYATSKLTFMLWNPELKKKWFSRYTPTSQDPFQRTDYSWNRTFGDGKCCRLHVRIRDDERGQGPVHCQLLEHDGPGLLEQVSSQNELFDLIILFNWFQWNVWRAKIEEHETKGSSKWRNQYGKNKLTKNLE